MSAGLLLFQVAAEVSQGNEHVWREIFNRCCGAQYMDYILGDIVFPKSVTENTHGTLVLRFLKTLL